MTRGREEWRALDHCSPGKNCSKDDGIQEAEQVSVTEQISKELIVIKDSECINVQTTDTHAAISLQAGLQAAIAAIISIAIADTDKAKVVTQDIVQHVKTKQGNTQKLIIEECKDINVTTTDTDIAVNVQVLLQILIALVIKLDLF